MNFFLIKLVIAAILLVACAKGPVRSSTSTMHTTKTQSYGKNSVRHQGNKGSGDMLQRRERVIERLKGFDKNGDGIVNAEDVPTRIQKLFDRIDKNSDGKLNDDEMDYFKSNEFQRPDRRSTNSRF